MTTKSTIKAEKKTVEREVKTIVKEEVVNLTLTREQAEHLYLLAGAIGGQGKNDGSGYNIAFLNGFVPNFCGQVVTADKAKLRDTTSALYEALGETFYGPKWPKV